MSPTIAKPRTKTATKTQRPPLWKVILLNDDFTPREFVVQVLKAVFRHDCFCKNNGTIFSQLLHQKMITRRKINIVGCISTPG